MATRVHLADDHTMFREGLESILSSRADGIEWWVALRAGEKTP